MEPTSEEYAEMKSLASSVAKEAAVVAVEAGYDDVRISSFIGLVVCLMVQGSSAGLGDEDLYRKWWDTFVGPYGPKEG